MVEVFPLFIDLCIIDVFVCFFYFFFFTIIIFLRMSFFHIDSCKRVIEQRAICGRKILESGCVLLTKQICNRYQQRRHKKKKEEKNRTIKIRISLS